jgi:tRNA(Ile)-lysidine synthase
MMRTDLTEQLATDLREWMPVGQRYLVALSGGRDSMALMHFMEAAGYRDLVLCHVNHCLRGEESDGDEALVKETGEATGLRVFSTRIDVKAVAEKRKLSIETAAREARYSWFAEVAKEEKCCRVVTAHHSEDQVETVLINFFRGSGSRGISGMKRHSHRDVGGLELELFRPLLAVERELIDKYVEVYGIAFREDSSNAEAFALRNRVRHRLLPEVESIFGRNVRGAVLRAAELSRRDEAWMQANLDDLSVKVSGGLDVKRLRELPEALRDRCLIEWLRESGVPNCGFDEVSRVAEVAMSTDRPAKLSLPGDFHVRRREGVLFLEAPQP